VQQLGVVCSSTHPYQPSPISLSVGLHVGFFELARRSLTLRPAHAHGHQVANRYPEASDISSPPCLLRLLPAGADAGWDLHPLESAALHGARDTQPPIPTFANGSYLRCDWPHFLVSASTLWRVNSTSVSRHQRALWNGAWCDPRCFGGFDSVETSLYGIYDNALFSGATQLDECHPRLGASRGPQPKPTGCRSWGDLSGSGR